MMPVGTVSITMIAKTTDATLGTSGEKKCVGAITKKKPVVTGAMSVIAARKMMTNANRHVKMIVAITSVEMIREKTIDDGTISAEIPDTGR